MASSSISATLFSSLSIPNSHAISQKPKPSCAFLPSPKALELQTLKSSRTATKLAAAAAAAPEALDGQETLDGPDSGAVEIMDAARTTNAKTMGPVPLPTKKRIYCVLKSPHVHKDARFHFEIRTHQRLIDILYPTAQTIDSLMQLDLPAGVDVEVKL
ncbi:hypothetical protein EUGRSUZ_F03697 [Eucalyptus grandis]|uniref:Uncharacterized protein n=2 Tax=Eucalyptus grandis TaxID=71139 RepID=A0ACC3KMB8_EUCGR|nr:hypothetical protein EUGRSUZ_F03697 [Eucalyptus grandis]